MLPRPSRPSRRGVARLGALACLAAGLVVAPAPQRVLAHEVTTRTEAVALSPRPLERRADLVSASLAAEPAVRAQLDAPHRRSVTRHVRAFEAIGVTLPAAPAAPVFLRGLVAGAWTPWFEADFSEDEAPDPGAEAARPGAHSQPVWMGGATAYEVDGPASVAEVHVHLVEEVTSASTVVAPPTAGAASGPGILPRSAWGARPPRQAPATSRDLKLAIVHHSVNANSYAASQVPAMLRAIQAYHQDVRGWSDIAYNVAVDRFGRTWEARAGGITENVLGGHSAGFNTGSLGVVVLGDFTRAAVPAATLEAVARVIAWRFALGRVDPASTFPYTTAGSSRFPAGTTVLLPRIVGHRDVQSTSCPGAQLHARLGTIRRRVAQLVPAYQRGTPPTLVAADLDGNGRAEVVEHGPGPAPDAIWRTTGTALPARTPVTITRTYRPVVADLDGNGYDDVVWHGSGTASDVIWWSRAGGTDSQVLAINGSYLPFAGDFDGNGRDDVLWYSTGLGAEAVWYLGADRSISTVRMEQDLITAVPVVGDFDGDGRDDVFWYGPGTADDEIWWSTGRAFRRVHLTVDRLYHPAALADAAAGRDDILMVDPTSSTSHRWEVGADRRIVDRAFHAPVATGAPIVGDYDGDGRDDVFLHATGARSAFWYTTATGVDARALTLSVAYVVASGSLDAGAPDDLLLVSPSGPDHLWSGHADRTITSTVVG
jgi:hypothetical protein